MKLKLNLLEKTKKSYVALIFWVILLLCFLFSSGSAFYYNFQLATEQKSKLATFKQQLSTAQLELETLKKQSKTEPINSEKIIELREQIDFVNQIRQQRHFYWTEFLNKFEQTLPTDIMLTSITPNPISNEVRLNGQAKSTQDIVNFIENLQNSPYFTEAFLNKQEKAKYQVKKSIYRTIERFSLSFLYQEEPS